MTEGELLKIINGGESLHVEFKKLQERLQRMFMILSVHFQIEMVV